MLTCHQQKNIENFKISRQEISMFTFFFWWEKKIEKVVTHKRLSPLYKCDGY